MWLGTCWDISRARRDPRPFRSTPVDGSPEDVARGWIARAWIAAGCLARFPPRATRPGARGAAHTSPRSARREEKSANSAACSSRIIRAFPWKPRARPRSRQRARTRTKSPTPSAGQWPPFRVTLARRVISVAGQRAQDRLFARAREGGASVGGYASVRETDAARVPCSFAARHL